MPPGCSGANPLQRSLLKLRDIILRSSRPLVRIQLGAPPSTPTSNRFVNHVKIIVEKHNDGYVAYPVGLKGVVVGEGDTYDEAPADVTVLEAFYYRS
jgi:hypothetical protein